MLRKSLVLLSKTVLFFKMDSENPFRLRVRFLVTLNGFASQNLSIICFANNSYYRVRGLWPLTLIASQLHLVLRLGASPLALLPGDVI